MVILYDSLSIELVWIYKKHINPHILNIILKVNDLFWD